MVGPTTSSLSIVGRRHTIAVPDVQDEPRAVLTAVQMDALSSVPMFRPPLKRPGSGGYSTRSTAMPPDTSTIEDVNTNSKRAVTKQSLEIALDGRPAMNGWMVRWHQYTVGGPNGKHPAHIGGVHSREYASVVAATATSSSVGPGSGPCYRHHHAVKGSGTKHNDASLPDSRRRS